MYKQRSKEYQLCLIRVFILIFYLKLGFISLKKKLQNDRVVEMHTFGKSSDCMYVEEIKSTYFTSYL